jgi:perosamine synthetase
MVSHNQLTLGNEELFAAERVIKSKWLAQGKEVEAFENELCSFLGLSSGHAVAFASCSISLYFALWALGAKEKKVAFPIYVSRVLKGASSLAGAKEVYLDIDKRGPNLDLNSPDLLESDILVAPHMFGIPCDLTKIKNLDVVENCAHSLGGKIGASSTGLVGRIGVFSFQATKLITSGGMGGALISRDKSLIDFIRDYRDFDERRDMLDHLNYRMTDIQAAIGREQLKKYPKWIGIRENLYQVYKSFGLPLLDIPPDLDASPIRYRAVLRTDNAIKIIKALELRGVKAIVPIEMWELISQDEKFVNARNLTRQSVSLPIYPELAEDKVVEIAKIVSEYL